MAKTDSPMIPPALLPFVVPITEVNLWGAGNPRHGDVGAISESLKRFGQVKPIIVQKSTMKVVAGNHVLRAASALGWTEIAAVVTDMTDKQAKAYLATDNRSSELGTFDEHVLAALLADIAKNDTLEGTGYDLDDLEDLLAKVGTGTGGGGRGDPDAQKDIPAEPWVQVGQMFQLGNHRLICGDGRDIPTIQRLLGDKDASLLLMAPGKSDDYTSLVGFFDGIAEQFWFDPWSYGLFDQFASLVGKGSWLVWDKQAENTEQQFGDGFEMVWSGTSHKQDILRYTYLGAADGDKHGGPDFTERPTALYQEMYERWSSFEAIICDPFSLGGTALLAAEKSGRMYYGAKKSPAHVQALLEKWKDFSGFDAEEIPVD